MGKIKHIAAASPGPFISVGDAAPDKYRTQHHPVTRDDKQLADINGDIGNPYRIVDTLRMMERAGTITPEQRVAGENFRVQFSRAGLVSLRAADLSRIGHSENTAQTHQIDGRNAIWAALGVMGGIRSRAGSCAWHVLGEQQSLREWAGTEIGSTSRSRLNAAGILIAVLDVLAAFFDDNPHFIPVDG